MCNEVNTEILLFCPVPDCSHYQKTDNKITKDGVYTTKSDSVERQMFFCHGGNHRFSETRYSKLFGKLGSFKEYEMVAKMNCYGLSSENIADVLDKDVRTIKTWLSAIGHKAEQFHVFICLAIQLNLLFVQMDELWSYIGHKKHQLWVFIAIDAPTKFWINFELGSRTNNTASRLVLQLKRFGSIPNGTIIKFTTDKLAAYKNALQKHFAEIPYHYLQIVKQRYKRRLVTIKKFFVKGSEKDFPSGTQNTSFIERFNLTLRQHVSILARKTLGFCKSKVNFQNNMWINLFNYNYIQFHKSLRVKIRENSEKFKKRYQHNTPAMKMGLTGKALNWKYLLTIPIIPSG